MRRFALLALVLLLSTVGFAEPPSPPAAPATPARFPGLDTIRGADLMKTVEFLASRPLAGRLAGSPGFIKAARWMADRFRRLGLQPGGENGFFQPLQVEYNEIKTCRLGLVDGAGATRFLRLGEDFVCRGLTGSNEISVPVVFAGYGLSRPELGYDDYAGLDVRAKVVLVFKEPPSFKVDSAGWGDLTLPRPKGRVAAAHGALGMLLVSRPNQSSPQRPIGSMLEGDGPEDGRFPMLQVDIPVADQLLKPARVKLADLEAWIDSSRSPHSLEPGSSVAVDVLARYQAKRASVNVVGILEGADPALRDQYVVVGAHLDHVGSQAGEIHFPGANDNASGSAAVLGIAVAFVRGGARPKRSVIFALLSSEEAGLNGAKRFVAGPPVPLEKIVCYLNLDCVGHGDSIQVGSGKTSPKLWQLARDLDQRGSGLMVEETWGGGGADATPFAEKKIPTLYFASKYSYTHIHLPSDTPATLNPRLFEALTRLGYETAWRVAEGEYAGE